MNIAYTEIDGHKIAEVISDDALIHHAQDALELLANCGYNGATGVIVQETNLSTDFFDLRTGIAGEILQKFSTYQMRMAIVGEYSKFSSKSLKDFIYESNKVGRINFVTSVEEGRQALTKSS
jgi:ABC-type branched-subunit amino acid transport system substrate-binding protein